MKITVLGDVYAVSEPVGRKFYRLMAAGVDELVAAREAVTDPDVMEQDQPTEAVDREDRLFDLATKALDATSREIHVHNAAPEPAVVNVAMPEQSPSITIEPAAPFVEAIADLKAQLAELNRPRRIVRNEQGRVIGLEVE